MLMQLWVPRGWSASPSVGQAGEDRLPHGGDDGGGTDTGVVPPQGDGVMEVFNVSKNLCKPEKKDEWAVMKASVYFF